MPERIRIQMVVEFPRPEDPDLFEFADHAGFFSPNMHGLTLGYGVFIRNGFRANRLRLSPVVRRLVRGLK